MKKAILKKLKFGILFLFAIQLAACSSGEGDGGSIGGFKINPTYIGKLGEALIDKKFYNFIRDRTLEIGLQVSNNLTSNNQQIKFVQQVSILNSSTISEILPPAPCAISGSSTTTKNDNPDTGEFSNSTVYNECAISDGTILNGKETEIGKVDTVNKENNYSTITFVNFSMQSNNSYRILNGTTEYRGDRNKITKADLVEEDKLNNIFIYIADYIETAVVTSTESTATVEVTIYHSSYGYLTVNSAFGKNIITDINVPIPRSGEFVYTGAVSSAGQTTITLTYTSIDTFVISGDFNGDGIAEITENCSYLNGCN